MPGPSVASVGEIKKNIFCYCSHDYSITFLYVRRRITVSGIFDTYGHVIDCVKAGK